MMYSFFSSTNPPPAEDDYIDEIIYEEEETADAPGGVTKEKKAADVGSKPPPKNSGSWAEAHDRYCRKKGRLRSTIQEIWDDLYGGMQQEETLELPWALPTSSTVVTRMDDLSLPTHAAISQKATTARRTAAGQEAASTSALVWGLAKRAASGLYSTVFSADSSDNVACSHDEADDANLYGNSSSWTTTSTATHNSELSWDQPIVHVKLVQETFIALQAYHRHCCNLRLHEPGPIILKRSEWIPWLAASEHPLLKGLSSEDASWFLNVLVAHQVVRIWNRGSNVKEPRPELILLSNLEGGIAEDKTCEAFVTLYDLKESQKVVESQLDRWTEQASEAAQKALNYKRQGQTKLALGQLSKRKMLQAQIDHSSSTLIQLEQIQAAIDTAHSNQAMMDLMSQGSQLLQKLNKSNGSPSLEEIDDLKEDLLEEMDHVQEVHKALVSSSANTNTEDDDAALLKELESMTLAEPQQDGLSRTNTTRADKNKKIRPRAITKTSTIEIELESKAATRLSEPIAS